MPLNKETKPWSFGKISLPLFPGPLWLEVVAPVRITAMGLIEMINFLIVCKHVTDIELLMLDSNIWNHLTVCKKIF